MKEKKIFLVVFFCIFSIIAKSNVNNFDSLKLKSEIILLKRKHVDIVDPCTKEPVKRKSIKTDKKRNKQKSNHEVQIGLNSASKGFVVSTSTESEIVNPSLGMIIYDDQSKCLKIFSDRGWNCITKACNDE